MKQIISYFVFLMLFTHRVHAQQDFQADYDTWIRGLSPQNVGVINSNAQLGYIVGYFLPYVLTIAGLILFGILIAGGFTMLAGAASKESQEKGKGMITSALTGFAIIFLAYWIAQILQVVFKIGIVTQ